ncbi:uncharacterized protein LOC135395895 [Ornithodoros turicata]|uniref:uncharacterized protein LOC135395895 n=1 Tax=Ornithodoros turicata TaxID=34597 RepID=UPI0031394EC0
MGDITLARHRLLFRCSFSCNPWFIRGLIQVCLVGSIEKLGSLASIVGTFNMEKEESVAGSQTDESQSRQAPICASVLRSSPCLPDNKAEVDAVDISVPQEYSVDDLWYRMDHEQTGGRRGICDIIKCGEGAGTQKDIEMIRDVFHRTLGFVDPPDNPKGSSHTDIACRFQTLARTDDSRSECFACFVLGQKAKDISSCNDVQQIIKGKIYPHFNSKACEWLSGKPKLFFFQPQNISSLMFNSCRLHRSLLYECVYE